MTPWRFSTKTAAALAFLAIAAVPVWLAWELSQGVAVGLERQRAVEAQVGAAVLSLERYARDVAVGFGLIADRLEQSGKAGPDPAAMAAFGFRHVCTFDAVTGALTGASAPDDLPCPDRPDAARLGIMQSLAVGGEVRFGRVMVDPTGEPVLYLMRRAGATIAVGALDTGYFDTLAGGIGVEDCHAFILDGEGRVIASSAPGRGPPLADFSDIGIVQRMLAGEPGADVFFSPVAQETVAGTAAPVSGPNWGVLVSGPERAEGGGPAIVLVALTVAAALAMLAAHLMLDPVRRIRMAAERLGNGDGEVSIPPTGERSRLKEIDELRAAFATMASHVRHSRRAVIEARREAEEATRTKSRFLANMSHELRTPLNAIIGFAEVTQRRMTEPERERDREYLGYIHDSGIHLLSIINDLLDLSRIEAGAWTLDEEDVDVSRAIRDSRAMLGTLPEDKGITLTLGGVDRAILLWADRRAIRQILLNLATNAVRYTQEGGRVNIACTMEADGTVSLVVEDNGSGIAADELMKIRAPFARGQAHEAAAIPGTGLGLSIVDALADLHGAHLNLVSEPGRGTRATVVFPANRTLANRARRSERTAAQ